MSMTLQEAAIKSCEDRIKHLESTPIHHYGKRQRERAIELERVKIAALRPVSREQVEKMRGEWIIEDVGDGDRRKKCSLCNQPISGWWGRDRFCANCGSPMTDKAVDMVMERLEALKDGKE